MQGRKDINMIRNRKSRQAGAVLVEYILLIALIVMICYWASLPMSLPHSATTR